MRFCAIPMLVSKIHLAGERRMHENMYIPLSAFHHTATKLSVHKVPSFQIQMFKHKTCICFLSIVVDYTTELFLLLMISKSCSDGK